MVGIDYIVIVIYFLGLIAVSVLVSRSIKSSADMFIAGRNSSWWLSGMSTYMTLFSASTFVIWGGVAFRSGFVAVLIGNILGFASFFVGRYLSGKWREMKIKSPGEYLTIRFGKRSLNFYTLLGIIGRGFHTAVALYAIAIVMSTLMTLPQGHFMADASGHLAVSWAIVILGVITLLYTILGGFLAVLMTDVIQFGVLITVVIFMIPLSINAIGGLDNFIAGAPEGYFTPVSAEYPWFWLILWFFVNSFTIGGDWPFVQRYISVPTVSDARKSTYLVGALYLLTPLIWYFPAMVFRQIEPTANPEQAYILMSDHVLMKGMLGVMLAAMVSATLSTVSGTLNVFANVFTYDIYGQKHPEVGEKGLIRIGRIFTFAFGTAIIALALLIPYAGGAEKVVVTILTMIIGPLYIPSVWGVFSKRLTQKHLLTAMIITYACGIFGLAFKFSDAVRANFEWINPNVLESVIGTVVPVILLSIMELWAKRKGTIDPGYARVQAILDPQADTEPSAEMKRATKRYSHMAVTCFVVTLLAIAALLIQQLFTESYDAAVERIMIGGIAVMVGIAVVYAIYRYIDAKHN
ncbi:MAG: sodium:solute symporter [Rikenellaceae bacterium]|nr:sodium:solute symporter [Rikenellaceae bacterium]